MNYRLKYSVCPLHDEPLNYICLHTNCESDRVICAICREEQHAEAHHTLPLKIYLCQKLQKLRCLTETQISTIKVSLSEQKMKHLKQLDQLLEGILLKIDGLKNNFCYFYEKQLKAFEEYEILANKEEINIQKINMIQEGAKAVTNFQEYNIWATEEIVKVSTLISEHLENLQPAQVFMDHSWVAHSEISLNRNIISSKNSAYKIAYLEKPLTKSSKINFKMLSNSNNWITVGLCHSNIVEQRNFTFRYHTIGHGVYGLSSNGAIWSHFKPECNNRLESRLTFSQNETITVGYDMNSRQAIFENQEGDKMSLDIEEKEKGTLHFCVVMYYKDDEVEVIYDLI